jgi:hypothetical protein
MLTSTIEGCPEGIWTKAFAGVPFWREAYHALFWMHNFLGDQDKRFQFQPFGVDIDPRLFTPPNNTCEQAEALAYAKQTTTYVDEVFEKLSLDALRASDGYDESDFRCVYHRLMYGLRPEPGSISRLPPGARHPAHRGHGTGRAAPVRL